MTMKLLASPASPFARKVRIVLTEKRIDCDIEVVDVQPVDNPVNAHNPLGKIPTLVLDDGTALYDSRVIVEFLDNASPISRLIPEDNRERLAVRRWEALADIALGCCLGWIGFRKPAGIDWRAEYKGLAKHYDKLLERSAFADTVPAN